MKTNLQTIL